MLPSPRATLSRPFPPSTLSLAHRSACTAVIGHECCAPLPPPMPLPAPAGCRCPSPIYCSPTCLNVHPTTFPLSFPSSSSSQPPLRLGRISPHTLAVRYHRHALSCHCCTCLASARASCHFLRSTPPHHLTPRQPLPSPPFQPRRRTALTAARRAHSAPSIAVTIPAQHAAAAADCAAPLPLDAAAGAPPVCSIAAP